MAPQNRKSWVGTTTCKEGSWISGLESPKFSCCRCSHCATVLADTAHWTSLRKPPLRSPVKIGDRVAVKQRRDSEEARVRMGVVKYVGDLNSPHTSDPVFIGVKLDDPVGEHDGMFCGKRFFSCPEGHGLIVPAIEIKLLATNNRRQKRVGPPNSMVLGSERERVGLLARRERGLESMLSKPWARNRISALSGAESCRDRNTPTPNGSSLASSRAAQAAMSEKTRKGAVIGGAPANTYSNEGDMFVEDVERDTGSPAVGRRTWRSVPIMRGAVDEQQGTTESGTTKTRISRASEIITSTTVEKSRIGADPGERGGRVGSGSAVTEKRRSKYNSSQFSGLSGALHSDPGNPESLEKDGESSTNSDRTNSSTAVKNVESSLAERQGKPRSPSDWTRSNSEAVVIQQCCQVDSTVVEAHTPPQIETFESREEVELIFSPSSSSSSSLPPAPPGTSVDVDQASAISRQDSLSSCAMSWIPSFSRSLPSPSVEREAAAKAGSTPDRNVPSLTRGVGKELEGDMRVRMMTSTYHKLRKALKKGMREMQWQRKIQEIESSGLYPAQTRRCGVLRESADMNGNAAAKVNKESFSLKRRKGTKLATVASAQAKLELEEGKGNVAHNEIMSYPSSAGSGKIRDIKKMSRNILKRTIHAI